MLPEDDFDDAPGVDDGESAAVLSLMLASETRALKTPHTSHGQPCRATFKGFGLTS